MHIIICDMKSRWRERSGERVREGWREVESEVEREVERKKGSSHFLKRLTVLFFRANSIVLLHHQ